MIALKPKLWDRKDCSKSIIVFGPAKHASMLMSSPLVIHYQPLSGEVAWCDRSWARNTLHEVGQVPGIFAPCSICLFVDTLNMSRLHLQRRLHLEIQYSCLLPQILQFYTFPVSISPQQISVDVKFSDCAASSGWSCWELVPTHGGWKCSGAEESLATEEFWEDRHVGSLVQKVEYLYRDPQIWTSLVRNRPISRVNQFFLTWNRT